MNLVKRLLNLLIAACCVSSYTYFRSPDLYSLLVKEDGIFENLTALALLLMGVLVLIKVIRSNDASLKWKVFNICLGLLCIFGFGEEISWGQRLFGYQPSDSFVENNMQREANIHNLKIWGIELNKTLFSTGLTIVLAIYFLFTRRLRKAPFFGSTINQLGVPIPKRSQTLILLLCTALIVFLPDGKRWEFWETSFVLTLFLVLIDPENEETKLGPVKQVGIQAGGSS